MKTKFSVILVFSLLVLVLAGCAAKNEPTESIAAQSFNLIAEGRLFPVDYLDHNFTITGYVDEVMVTNDEIVKEDQELATLISSPDARLALARAQEELIAAEYAVELLNETSALTLATAELDLTIAQDTYDDALGNSWTIGRPVGSENSIRAAELALDIAEAELARSVKKVTKMSYLPENNLDKLNAQSAMVNLQQKVNTLMTQLNYLKSTPDEIKTATLSSDLSIAEATLKIASDRLEKIKANDGLDPNEEAAAEARLTASQAAVASAQAAVDAFTLRAKMDGQVVDLNLKPGQLVSPELLALSIADFSQWVVYTDNLTEIEVTELEVGQSVEITLDALPDTALTGKITHINSRYEEKRGEITYTVTILLTETDPRMRWGMTAAVNFIP